MTEMRNLRWPLARSKWNLYVMLGFKKHLLIFSLRSKDHYLLMLNIPPGKPFIHSFILHSITHLFTPSTHSLTPTSDCMSSHNSQVPVTPGLMRQSSARDKHICLLKREFPGHSLFLISEQNSVYTSVVIMYLEKNNNKSSMHFEGALNISSPLRT